MQKKVRIPVAKGKTLSGVLHTPKKLPAPAVIVCHGFTSSKINKESYCNFLEKNGFVALSFDFNGHGQSYGPFREMAITKCVKDLAAAVRFLRKQKYVKKIGITGSSMGGMVVLIYASRNPVSAIVPVSTVTDFGKTMVTRDSKAMQEWEKRGVRYFDVRTGGWQRKKRPLSYSYFSDGMKYDMKKVTGKVRSPALLIHGDKDKHTLVEDTKLYFRKYLHNPKRLIIFRGAGHNHEFRKRETDRMFRESLAWFRKYLA